MHCVKLIRLSIFYQFLPYLHSHPLKRLFSLYSELYEEDSLKIQGLWGGGVDWIDPAQDRVKCWALQNTVLNLGVP